MSNIFLIIGINLLIIGIILLFIGIIMINIKHIKNCLISFITL